jgi:hypothetical protein
MLPGPPIEATSVTRAELDIELVLIDDMLLDEMAEICVDMDFLSWLIDDCGCEEVKSCFGV